MDESMIEHKNDVIKILSGGLGEGMDKHNYEERVNTAIAATCYLSKRILKIYEKARGKQINIKQIGE